MKETATYLKREEHRPRARDAPRVRVVAHRRQVDLLLQRVDPSLLAIVNVPHGAEPKPIALDEPMVILCIQSS